jgi:hypothetical protein
MGNWVLSCQHSLPKSCGTEQHFQIKALPKHNPHYFKLSALYNNRGKQDKGLIAESIKESRRLFDISPIQSSVGTGICQHPHDQVLKE